MAQSRGDAACRCDLNNLLVASLDAAIALEQVYSLPAAIAQDLHFDVPYVAQVFLNEDRAVTEGHGC